MPGFDAEQIGVDGFDQAHAEALAAFRDNRHGFVLALLNDECDIALWTVVPDPTEDGAMFRAVMAEMTQALGIAFMKSAVAEHDRRQQEGRS